MAPQADRYRALPYSRLPARAAPEYFGGGLEAGALLAASRSARASGLLSWVTRWAGDGGCWAYGGRAGARSVLAVLPGQLGAESPRGQAVELPSRQIKACLKRGCFGECVEFGRPEACCCVHPTLVS